MRRLAGYAGFRLLPFRGTGASYVTHGDTLRCVQRCTVRRLSMTGRSGAWASLRASLVPLRFYSTTVSNNEWTASDVDRENDERLGTTHARTSVYDDECISEEKALTATREALGGHSGTTEDVGSEANPPPRLQWDDAMLNLLRDTVPLCSTDAIKDMLKGAKNAKEVRHILERVVYRHHLCFDPLNGHGYRVAVLHSLTSISPRTQCMYEWFDCVDKFRKLGFILTRTFAAEGITTIRQWLTHTFDAEGRTPRLVTEGTSHIRELIYWCQEDRLVFDHVLYTRIIFLLTMIVSYFDRQNLYRSSFPPDFTKRDGIVVEWISASERCVDYDECVVQCDALLEEVLEMLRKDIPSRPIFSLMYRLIDYYFATDNVEKMLAVMEDAENCGVSIAESSAAKLMQLACALNYPNALELFMRWRVALPQCVLATPDMSRLMFYFARSGGGRPCPVCGEPYNHRNVNVYHWMQTPPHQRNCAALRMSRKQKGELEENRDLPQNADWSAQAFQLWELSRARSIDWGPVEWRAFLLCCMFSKRALEAKEHFDNHFDAARMDDFLRATYVRLLRHHAPELADGVITTWQQRNFKMSPIALQEALMAVSMVSELADRLSALRHVWASVKERDSYVMPFTKRFFERRARELLESGQSSEDERHLLQEIIDMQPRHVSLLDMKDSASDFVVGSGKKNVYISPRFLERRSVDAPGARGVRR